jgi:uncharacterized protein YcbX
MSSVQSIWRYPVKSMGGEQIAEALVTPRGVLGDRAYALVDRAGNRVAPTRMWATGLYKCSARFVGQPQPDAPPPPVEVTLPGEPPAPGADAVFKLSAQLGHTLELLSSAPEGLRITFPAGTLGGKMSQVTENTVGAGAPPGTFFDFASVQIVAASTLAHLQSVYPSGRFDVRRFRPNFVIETDAEPFVENSWAGHLFALGDEVQLRGMIPTPRCVNTTVPQGDLPHDPGILRTIAQLNRLDLGDYGHLPCVGAYFKVVAPGRVRPGDALRMLE